MLFDISKVKKRRNLNANDFYTEKPLQRQLCQHIHQIRSLRCRVDLHVQMREEIHEKYIEKGIEWYLFTDLNIID